MDTNVRPESMARITTKELADAFIAEQIEAVRAQVGDKKVLLALSGGVDSSFADAQYISSSAIANCDFVLNTINYLGGTSVESGIRAKNISPDSFTLDPDETKRITLVLLLLIPVVIFAAAFVVWIRRRFK